MAGPPGADLLVGRVGGEAARVPTAVVTTPATCQNRSAPQKQPIPNIAVLLYRPETARSGGPEHVVSGRTGMSCSRPAAPRQALASWSCPERVPCHRRYGHSWPVRWGAEGQPRMVKVYSNCSTAELFVNGEFRRHAAAEQSGLPAAPGLHWWVKFAPAKTIYALSPQGMASRSATPPSLSTRPRSGQAGAFRPVHGSAKTGVMPRLKPRPSM